MERPIIVDFLLRMSIRTQFLESENVLWGRLSIGFSLIGHTRPVYLSSDRIRVPLLSLLES
jgi:hypothetical protein